MSWMYKSISKLPNLVESYTNLAQIIPIVRLLRTPQTFQRAVPAPKRVKCARQPFLERAGKFQRDDGAGAV